MKNLSLKMDDMVLMKQKELLRKSIKTGTDILMKP